MHKLPYETSGYIGIQTSLPEENIELRNIEDIKRMIQAIKTYESLLKCREISSMSEHAHWEVIRNLWTHHQ